MLKFKSPFSKVNKKNKEQSTASHIPPPPPLPPGKRPTKYGTILHDDSSWIKPENNLKELQRTKRISSMKAMTQAFLDSVLCSLDEVESYTSEEERIGCIHFGNMLIALDAMKDCMDTYGMKRTTVDLKYHCAKARVLYDATPPDQRDFLSSLLKKPSSRSQSSEYFSKPFMRSFSIHKQLARRESSSPKLKPDETRVSCPAAIQSCPESDAPTTSSLESSLPSIDSSDRELATKSMFWLCSFVRYTYNVHRLVLQVGHDPIDASSMAFMRYLYPYFGDYYNKSGDDAKTFLTLLTDYQNETFLKDNDSLLLEEVKLFLGALEVVMYLWTPAFQEQVLEGVNQRHHEFLSL